MGPLGCIIGRMGCIISPLGCTIGLQGCIMDPQGFTIRSQGCIIGLLCKLLAHWVVLLARFGVLSVHWVVLSVYGGVLSAQTRVRYRRKGMCYRPAGTCIRPRGMWYRPDGVCYRVTRLCYQVTGGAIAPQGCVMGLQGHGCTGETPGPPLPPPGRSRTPIRTSFGSSQSPPQQIFSRNLHVSHTRSPARTAEILPVKHAGPSMIFLWDGRCDEAEAYSDGHSGSPWWRQCRARCLPYATMSL